MVSARLQEPETRLPEAARQRCYVHFLRNALDHLPRKHADDACKGCAGSMLAAIGKNAGWFEDYNENHPHSGLKMRYPGEFIRAQTQ
jgi:Transposase, Mutator family